MPRHLVVISLLGLGLLAQQPLAARLSEDETDGDTPAEVLARVNKLFKGGSGTVCGGKEIREILSADPSIQRIRNLPWSKVMAIADDFIKAQTNRVNVLTTELDQLRKAAADAALKEMPAELSPEQINAAVREAVSDPASFISLPLAQETGCGGVRPKDRKVKLAKGGYEKAEALFTAAMQKLLSGGNLRVDGANLHVTCHKLLFTGSTAGDFSFCNELCHSFSDAAEQISDAKVGGSGGKKAADLQRQADEKQNQLRFAAAELAECSAAKTDLQGFQAQLQQLQTNIETSFTTVREARNALQDATQDLQDIGDDVETQTKAVKGLQDAVKGLGDKVQAAQQQLQALTDKNADVQKAIKQGEQNLGQASLQVKKAGDAAAAAQSLKAQLSALLMKLSLFFDAAIRKPLRDMGLSDPSKTFFPKQLEDTASMQDAQQALVALRGYCDQQGVKAKFADFDALSAPGPGEAPASSLCDFGSVPDVRREIVTSVSKHISKLEEALNGLRTWLNPYLGNADMTKEKAAQLVEQGEPQGLREMVSVLSETNFFKGYLTYWQVSEKFQKLFARLGKALEESQKQEAKFQKEIAGLQTQLAEGLKAQQAAAEAVKQAIAASTAQKKNLEVAQRELKTLQDQQKSMEDKLAKLKKALADAQANYEAAKTALEETHKQGTAFVEVLKHLEAAIGEHGLALVQMNLKLSQPIDA